MLKKLGIVVGIIIGIFLLVALLLPVFFDANKYKPQIEKLVEENVNADLQLGALNLSLWGGLHLKVEKLVLSEQGTRGAKPIVSLNDFRIEIPLFSVLLGHPDITINVKKPEINIISGADGKLNVSKLAKNQNGVQPQGQSTSGSSGAAAALPFSLSFEIKDGHLTYLDQLKNSKTSVGGINFDLRHFGFNKPFSFKYDSMLDVKQGADLSLQGPAKFSGTAAIYMNSSGLDHLDLDLDADVSGLAMKYSTLLNKSAKVPLSVSAKLATSTNSIKLEKFEAQMGDATVGVSGTVNNFAAPDVNLHVVSNKFVFDQFQDILGSLKQMNMKGSANFDIKMQGTMAKLAMDGKADIQDVSLNVPGIVPRVTNVQAQIQFSNDTASLKEASIKLGASDVEMAGTAKNFSHPVIVFNVRSKNLDVDSILPQKPQSETAQTTQNQRGEDLDLEKTTKGPIAALKGNPTARTLDFTGHFQADKLKVHKADLSNVKAEVTFKDLVMGLKQASAQAFGGTGAVNSSIDFRGADPIYSASGQIEGMDTNAAISSQMVSAKDVLFGKAYAKFDFSGSGLSKAKVNHALKGKGNFRVENGSWSSLNVMGKIGEYVKKIPGAQEKIGAINITDKFKNLKSDFTIANGRFNIVNMIAEMENARTGLTGQGYVDFDMNLALKGKIMTPGGDDVPSDVRGSDGRLNIPYELQCKVTAPCPKFDEATKALAQAYGKRVLKKVLQDNINNPTVKDLLKKLPF